MFVTLINMIMFDMWHWYTVQDTIYVALKETSEQDQKLNILDSWLWSFIKLVLGKALLTGLVACVGEQPACASLTSLHLPLSSIHPSTHSFIYSAVHSSPHPSIQTSIHLLRPLTHFTYKCLCFVSVYSGRKCEKQQTDRLMWDSERGWEYRTDY